MRTTAKIVVRPMTGLLALCALGLLGACGQKGSLYLPTPAAAAPQAASPSTAVAPSARPTSNPAKPPAP